MYMCVFHSLKMMAMQHKSLVKTMKAFSFSQHLLLNFNHIFPRSFDMSVLYKQVWPWTLGGWLRRGRSDMKEEYELVE